MWVSHRVYRGMYNFWSLYFIAATRKVRYLGVPTSPES